MQIRSWSLKWCGGAPDWSHRLRSSARIFCAQRLQLNIAFQNLTQCPILRNLNENKFQRTNIFGQRLIERVPQCHKCHQLHKCLQLQCQASKFFGVNGRIGERSDIRWVKDWTIRRLDRKSFRFVEAGSRMRSQMRLLDEWTLARSDFCCIVW